MTDRPHNDDLQAELASLASSVPVTPQPGLPQARYQRKVRRARVGAGVLAALAIGAVGIRTTVGTEESNTVSASDGVETIEQALESGEPISFSERTVVGDVNYPQWYGQAPDGTLYVLSTSPGARWPDPAEVEAAGYYAELPQAIYSTTDGETWSITELGDRTFGSLSMSNGVLYGLTTSETASGGIVYEYLSSPDGGSTWNGAEIPAPGPESGEAWARSVPSTSAAIVSTDAAHLAVITTWWEPDWTWLLAQFGLDESTPNWPEFTEDSVVIRDYAACNEFMVSNDNDGYRRFEELLASGMTEEEAYRVLEEELPDYPSTHPTDVSSDEPASDAAVATTAPALANNDEAVATTSYSDEAMSALCENPPILQEKSFAELGIEGDPIGSGDRSVLRSTDGINWSPVDAPGDYIYAAGNRFYSQTWNEENPEATTISTSRDGLEWAEVTLAENLWREFKAPLDGQITSFTTLYMTSGDEGAPESGEVIFGRSNDGVAWDDVVVSTFTNSEIGFVGPVVQEVGPIGALVVIQHDAKGSYDTYDDRLEGLSYEVRYSPDGVHWQTIELQDTPRGTLNWGFVTSDSIGLSFSKPSTQPDEPGETVTVLLTPER